MKPAFKRTLWLIALAAVALHLTRNVAAQPDNPFEPAQLSQTAAALGKAVQGKGSPADTPLAIVANDLAPFWTAGQIGSQRAASELGVPVIFSAPIRPGDKLGQKKIFDSFVEDGYKGISISAIDPVLIAPGIQAALDNKINIITLDSDAPNTKRLLYVGTDNYNAGVVAGKALIAALGDKGGKVIGLVGTLTAQNAIDRIRGIEDTLKDTKVNLAAVLIDNLDPLQAVDNAGNALQQYPDLAAFITLYSYDGSAAGKALKIANMVGKIKIIAFDLEPETIALLKQGTISAAIGQRPYYMGYLSVYVLYAMAALGPNETMELLKPYLSGEKKDIIDTGVDIVTVDTLAQYSEYLNSIGIKSQ